MRHREAQVFLYFSVEARHIFLNENNMISRDNFCRLSRSDRAEIERTEACEEWPESFWQVLGEFPESFERPPRVHQVRDEILMATDLEYDHSNTGSP